MNKAELEAKIVELEEVISSQEIASSVEPSDLYGFTIEHLQAIILNGKSLQGQLNATAKRTIEQTASVSSTGNQINRIAIKAAVLKDETKKLSKAQKQILKEFAAVTNMLKGLGINLVEAGILKGEL